MKFAALSLCLPLAVAGCGSSGSSTDGASPTTATVQGALVTSTFASGATGVRAVDEAGAATNGTLSADGAFTLTLPKAHTYKLLVVKASLTEPIVFPRASGKLDTTFKLAGGGAVVDLGAVRHFDSKPAAGFSSVGASTQLLSSDPAPDDGADSESDGECENGVDQTTGAACTDPEEGDDDADPAGPMAIPEHNAPDDVAGCQGDGDGEEEDD